MNAKQLLIASVIVGATGAAVAPVAFAGDGSSLSRDEVKASVIQARASKQLRPAGEAAEPYVYDMAAGAGRTRADLRAEVLQARAEHTLIASGEAPAPYSAGIAPAPSLLARATVKEETRMARMNGELIPSGEASVPYSAGHARRAAGVAYMGLPWKWR